MMRRAAPVAVLALVSATAGAQPPDPDLDARQRCRPGNGALSSLKASGGRVAGADAFSARCSRLPLGVSSTGAGGWAERACCPRRRRRSADGHLTVPVAVGSIIRSH